MTKKYKNSNIKKTRKNKKYNVKTITIKNNILIENGEKNISFNNYTPYDLHIPKKYNIQAVGIIHYFRLSQTETTDEFIASIKQKYNGFEVLVGGRELHGCIIININKVDYYDPSSRMEAVLNIRYHEKCNITNDLSKGKGTIIMMRTAISFVFSYFKIDKFILKDVSTFQCTQTQHISLPALYILKYGQSWYEKHIHARTYNETLHKNIEKYKQFVETKPEWEFLYKTYILPEFRIYKLFSISGSNTGHNATATATVVKTIQHMKTVLYAAWLRNDNYRNFILDIISIDDQCQYLLNWFNDIFHAIVNQNLYGDVDNFVLYDDFPFIQGLQSTYMKTTMNGNGLLNDVIDDEISTLQKNEDYTINSQRGGGEYNNTDNVLFHKLFLLS